MELKDLFTNEIDFNTFCNLKAKGRILANEKAIEDFKNEIKESIDKCTEIFEKYHAETNFVTALMDLETKFQDLEHQKYNSAELDELTSKKEELYEEYNRFVNSLPLSIKEDLEFYSKRVLDREERLDHNNEIISELEHYFPNARELDVDKTFSTLDVLRNAMEYLNPELPELVDTEEKDTISMPYVTKITEAPDELINIVDNNEINPLDDVEIPKEPEQVSQINHDNSFFDPTDSFRASIENDNYSNAFEHIEEKEPEKFEFQEESITPLFTDLKPEPIEEHQLDNIMPEESITSLFNEEEPKEETAPVVETETVAPIEQGPTDSTAALEFTLNNGVTLTALAEAACGNVNGWKDIYENNKQIIDERLQLNGMTIEEAKDNDIALTGLKLAIPNVYNSLKEEDNSKTKVA